ncbi:Mitogen-activated protein kinase kinase kinase 9, partial [Camellia lanceoleosa]
MPQKIFAMMSTLNPQSHNCCFCSAHKASRATSGGIFIAVKEVSLLDQGDQGRQAFPSRQEIALLSRFEHENIVRYYGTDKDESNLYIFLELVTKVPLSLYQATKLNDIKSCKGTPYWMAPEVVKRNDQGYGLPADIWSLGCTVLEMLTRQIPYMQACSRLEGVCHHLFLILFLEMRDFIFRCLQVNPNDRPTAADLLDHPYVRRPLPSSSGSSSPYNFGRR